MDADAKAEAGTRIDFLGHGLGAAAISSKEKKTDHARGARKKVFSRLWGLLLPNHFDGFRGSRSNRFSPVLGCYVKVLQSVPGPNLP